MFAISDMMRVSLAQYVLIAVVAVVFGCFRGESAAVTVVIVGLGYAVPTSLCVLWLVFRWKSGARPNAATVLIWEFVKVLTVLSVITLTVKFYEELYWPALIVTIIAVANSYFAVLFKKH